MNSTGLIIGVVTVAVIAISRYLCIVGEYHFTKKIWIAFLLLGICGISVSLFLNNFVLSTISGIVGFSFLWGIGEVIEQEKRVEKGWFPKKKRKRD